MSTMTRHHKTSINSIRGSRALARLLPWMAALAMTPALALEVGEAVDDVTLSDAWSRTAALPDFGKKVLVVFYTDADVADMNDPLADAMMKRQFSRERLRSFGVVNLRDSFMPNFLIRAVVKGKVEKYATTILTDETLALPKAWRLGACADTSVVIVVGADAKVKLVHRGPIRGERLDEVLKLLGGLVAEPGPASSSPG